MRAPPASLLRPMLAVSTATPPAGPGWAWEVKWDGVRLLGIVVAGSLRLRTRTGRDVTARYPELAPLGAAVGHDAVLDGEVVALDARGRPSFQLLQRRMHVAGAADAARLAAEVGCVYMVFDLLWIDGDPIVDRPYVERRARLLALGLSGPAWQTPPHELGDGAALRTLSEELGLEGLVAKRADSLYRPGVRSRDWVKVKRQRRQELVVGGWVEGQGARAGSIGALLLGHWEHDAAGRRLRYAGRVGSGFTARDLAELHRTLRSIEQPASPFGAGSPPREAHFCAPVLVAEVRFTEWTDDGHVRQPVFLGLRADVDPDTVVREP
jgi:bifunctional non-homologous end joining protein LigD